MLRWKLILERWHLTHDDISICRLVIAVATQTRSQVCPACLDAIADERLQWVNLDLKKLVSRLDLMSLPEPITDARNAHLTFFGESRSTIDDLG